MLNPMRYKSTYHYAVRDVAQTQLVSLETKISFRITLYKYELGPKYSRSSQQRKQED